LEEDEGESWVSELAPSQKKMSLGLIDIYNAATFLALVYP